MKVLICAGGTGGGIYPALAAATELQKMGVQSDHILWIGTEGEMEEKLVPRAGLRLETIAGGPIVSIPLRTRLANAAKLLWSVGTAVGIVRRFRPDVMFMTGGYVAAPITLACRLANVPITIYLPDLEPGSAIRFSLRFARTIATTAEGSKTFVPAEKMVVTGYPVRPELRAATKMSRAEALSHFDLTPERPTLFVFGGSRGAWAINRTLMQILPRLLQTIQVIHITGTLTWPKVEAQVNLLPDELKPYYRPFPYLHEEMGAAFRAADLVLARAGASMLGEAPAFGVPAILVPLAWAWRYQKVNADFLTERGAAVQLTDEQLPAKMLPTVTTLIHDQDRLAQMSRAASALDAPSAAHKLAQVIAAAAQGGNA